MKLLLLALVAIPLFKRDLDVGIPPGTPLEWAGDLRHPVPTGSRANVPTGDWQKPGGNQTVVEDKKPKYDLGGSGGEISGFFQGTSRDLAGHVKWKPPSLRPSNDVATDDGSIVCQYPPEPPAELAWFVATACLRDELHPEAVSWAESAAFCLELGDAAYLGLVTGTEKRRVEPYLRRIFKPLPANRPLAIPSKDPALSMLTQLAATELTGGYPHAIDPTFAWRTLSLADEAFGAVHACSKSSHVFLARNAVSVLGTSTHPDSGLALREIWRETRDPIIWMRSLLSLARRQDKSIVPDLAKQLAGNDLPLQAAVLYALGLIGDPSCAAPLNAFARRVSFKEPELLWSLIPAMGRAKGTREALATLKADLFAKINRSDEVGYAPPTQTSAPQPEEVGSNLKILHQFALIAMAMQEEGEFRAKVVRRAQEGLDSFHPATHFLLAEVLPLTEKGAIIARKQFFDAKNAPLSLRVKTLLELSRQERLPAAALGEIVLDEREDAVIRARALQLLEKRDKKLAKETSARLVDLYASTGLPTTLAMVAAQVGGRLEAFTAAPLMKAVDRAVLMKHFGRREADQNADQVPPDIRFESPLLETLLIELGRTRAAEALPILSDHVKRIHYRSGRAEAILAIGAIPGVEAEKILVNALEDRDGWVRYMAYRALGKRGAPDRFADWIYGSSYSRTQAAGAYKEWLTRK